MRRLRLFGIRLGSCLGRRLQGSGSIFLGNIQLHELAYRLALCERPMATRSYFVLTHLYVLGRRKFLVAQQLV